MFCETCDAVFCTMCTGGSHNGRGTSAAHTVIPFSIAIKRMSEILLYKASLCLRHLGRALDTVTAEIEAVEASADRAADAVNHAFADVSAVVEQRRQTVLQALRKVRDDKQRVLKEQLDIIEAEKCKVEDECEGLQQQVEVRNITSKISDLNDKLDVCSTLAEPRENTFMQFEHAHDGALEDVIAILTGFGRIRISKTFPALCTAQLEPAVIHLHSCIHVSTVDYHGNPRTSGADPIEANICDVSSTEIATEIRDHDDGTYTITFTPSASGMHSVAVSVFGRSIRDSPFAVDVSAHNNPIMKVGGHGSGQTQFIQPVVAAVDTTSQKLYVLDAGNSRVKVLNAADGSFIRHTGAHGLEQRSGTGLVLTAAADLLMVNWRTRYVTRVNQRDDVVSKFSSNDFSEPVSIAVNSAEEIIVGDNGLGALLVFDKQGKFLRRIGSKGSKEGQFKLITCVYCAPNDNILVTDTSRLQVFSRSGKFLHQAPGKGMYGGITMDTQGNVLATRQEKGRCVIVIMDNADYSVRFTIDSNGDKLCRPSGLVTTDDGHVIVADLGNDCIKKYRYM